MKHKSVKLVIRKRSTASRRSKRVTVPLSSSVAKVSGNSLGFESTVHDGDTDDFSVPHQIADASTSWYEKLYMASSLVASMRTIGIVVERYTYNLDLVSEVNNNNNNKPIACVM